MPLETVSRAVWDDLTSRSEPGFHGRSDWIECTCLAAGLEPCYVVVTVRDEPALLVAVASRRRFGTRIMLNAPLSPYVGWAEMTPVGADDSAAPHLDEAVRLFAEWAEREFGYVRIEFPPEVCDDTPFTQWRWRSETRQTFRAPVRDMESLRPRRNIRRNIRAAGDAGISAKTLSGEPAVAALERVLSDTFARQGQSLPVKQPRWSDLLRAIVASPNVQTVVAVRDDEPLAAMAFGWDLLRAYEILAGATPAGLESGASALVRWAAFEAANERVDEFDLAGANVPSIAHYKSGFGGDLVHYHAVTWAGSRSAEWIATRAPVWKRRLLGILS